MCKIERKVLVINKPIAACCSKNGHVTFIGGEPDEMSGVVLEMFQPVSNVSLDLRIDVDLAIIAGGDIVRVPSARRDEEYGSRRYFRHAHGWRGKKPDHLFNRRGSIRQLTASA